MEKPQLNMRLPKQVMAVIEKRALSLEETKGEFAAQIIKWWYSQGSPPISQHDEFVNGEAIQEANDAFNAERFAKIAKKEEQAKAKGNRK